MDTKITRIRCAGHGTDTYSGTSPSGLAAEAQSAVPPNGHTVLPVGWQELPTGLNGARLYRIARPNRGDAYWQAEITLTGTVHRRYCTGELYARWWLTAVEEPRHQPGEIDWAELNGPLLLGFVRHASPFPNGDQRSSRA